MRTASPAAGAVLLALAVVAPPSTAAERLVHKYLEIAVSPGGKAVASVEGDVPPSGPSPPIRDLVIRRTDGSGGVVVTLPCGRVPQCWPSSMAWADDQHLAFALRTPGTHARSIYFIGVDGKNPRELVAFNGTIIDLRYGRDGRLAMLATEDAVKEVGPTQPGAPATGELGVIHEQRIAVLADGALKFISPPDLYVYEYDWQPDGHGFVGTAAPGDGDNQWWVAKLYAFDADGARILYAPADPRQQLAHPRVSRDGRAVAFIGGLMSDFGSTGGDAYLLPLQGGRPIDLTPGLKASVRGLTWDCGGQLILDLLAGSKTQIARLPPGGAAPRILWQAEESIDAGDERVSLGCPAEMTALVRESFTAPPEIAVGPLGNWHPLTNVNAGLTMPLEARSISWSNEGYDLQGWLLLPAHATGPLPMLTIVHGGPAAAAIPRFDGPGLNRAELEAGYALFRPNPRGSFGQGEAFTRANVRDLGYGDLRDILAGIDAVLKVAPIDGERLGLTGGSYGGFMTMWAITQSQRFKAAVAGAGISNWLSYYGENGIVEWMTPYFGASAYDDPYIYERSSAVRYIKNARTPTFAYGGEQDIECPAAQTREFGRALAMQGVPASIVIYPGEGHGLRDPEHLKDAERRTLDWFAKYLR